MMAVRVSFRYSAAPLTFCVSLWIPACAPYNFQVKRIHQTDPDRSALSAHRTGAFRRLKDRTVVLPGPRFPPASLPTSVFWSKAYRNVK